MRKQIEGKLIYLIMQSIVSNAQMKIKKEGKRGKHYKENRPNTLNKRHRCLYKLWFMKILLFLTTTFTSSLGYAFSLTHSWVVLFIGGSFFRGGVGSLILRCALRTKQKLPSILIGILHMYHQNWIARILSMLGLCLFHYCKSNLYRIIRWSKKLLKA